MPELGILRTNTFSVNLPGYDQVHSAVLEHTSRCNHSCTPNANIPFYLSSFSFQLRACRPIRRGEEITITYINLPDDRATPRQELRTKYSFHCECPSCSLSDEDSKKDDVARATIEKSDKVLGKALDEWLEDAGTKALPDDYVIAKGKEIVKLIEKTNVCEPYYWCSAMVPLVNAYLALGDKASAREWAVKGERMNLLMDEQLAGDFPWRVWIEEPESALNWRVRA